MDDYTGWAKWLEAMYIDLKVKAEKMNKECNIQRDNISLRKDYIQICSQWLVVCDVMRNSIEYAKERTTKQLEVLTK